MCAALAALLACRAAFAAADCAPGRISARHQAVYVYDGDTVRLADGRKLRLIGIDTPELGRNGAPPQPYALRARERLHALLSAQGNRIGFRHDRTRYDRYQRTLAHVYLPDGTNAAAELLRQGLGTALVVPPNLWKLGCYQAAEQQARERRRGIWSLPQYQPVEAAELDPGTRGFRLVTGRVVRVSHRRGSLWLRLDGPVVLRVKHDDLHYFRAVRPARLTGRRVLARGWLHGYRGTLFLSVRHPAALQAME
ncbi:MAG: thermonuclease family protein [Gammaproteobacteria bacterium]|nr:thermonuclease family protein [Gammaproteobacteria bacterium]